MTHEKEVKMNAFLMRYRNAVTATILAEGLDDNIKAQENIMALELEWKELLKDG